MASLIPLTRTQSNIFMHQVSFMHVSTVLLQVKLLPGIERNEKEQLQLLEILGKQLQMKKHLVAKYKELNLKVNGLSGANSFQ